MSLVYDLSLLLLGFSGLFFGGNWLITGANAIGKRLGISDFILGLTLVAFGTSAPELVVSTFAVLQNKPDLIFGNIIGSNIANTLLILGLTGIVFPIHIGSTFLKEKIRFNVACIMVLALLLFNVFWGGSQLIIVDGIILLTLFALYLYKVFGKHKEDTDIPEQISGNIGKSLVIFFAGCILLPLSGKMVINSAVSIAQIVGISEALISLVAIAIGTSLPELVTSIIAARKKQADLVLGNIIGSNIFNITLILGFSSLLSPLNYSPVFNFDLIVMCLSVVGLILLTYLSKSQRISKKSGAIMVLLYIGYIAVISLRG
jgi:cation:H+ antiporter